VGLLRSSSGRHEPDASPVNLPFPTFVAQLLDHLDGSEDPTKAGVAE
jgi:hypothetical protein